MKAKNLFLPILVAFLLISCKDKSSELDPSDFYEHYGHKFEAILY